MLMHFWYIDHCLVGVPNSSSINTPLVLISIPTNLLCTTWNHGNNRQAHMSHCLNRRPIFVKNVKANVPIGVYLSKAFQCKIQHTISKLCPYTKERVMMNTQCFFLNTTRLMAYCGWTGTYGLTKTTSGASNGYCGVNRNWRHIIINPWYLNTLSIIPLV